MGNCLTKCHLNSCFRIQLSSVSSLLTSSDDEDVDFLLNECENGTKVNDDGYDVCVGHQLPWNENYWSIKITHVVSPNEVWAILTKNAGLLVKAEQMVSVLTVNLANHIVIGKVYVVKRKHLLHRVKAIKIFMIEHERRLFVDCFYIDIGRIETIAYDELYDCADAFSKIPPQAICFKLFGFDELCYCPSVERYFGAWLMNKQLYACLMMGEEQYRIQLKFGIQLPKVSVTPFAFYPKFTLYKPILLKQIGESLPKPALSHHATATADTMINAKVSHVSPMGRVYFQLDELSMKYIGTLIQQFLNEKQQLTQRFHVSEATNCVVLIYDIERHIYHRAKIMAVKSGSSKRKCFCIDTGDTRSVEVSNIFGLNENSMLYHYPGQAVPAILHSVADFQHTTFERLNTILSIGTEVQVKVAGQKGTLPMVTVYKQSMNINAVICMERELHNCAAHATFPTDATF